MPRSLRRANKLVGPDHWAVSRVGIVGTPVRGLLQKNVVVVGHRRAVAELVMPVLVRAILQVQGNGAAGPVTEVALAAVIGAAVVKTHVPLGNYHGYLAHVGVVELRVLPQELLEVFLVALGEV